MNREEILEKAQRAQQHVAGAAAAINGFISGMQGTTTDAPQNAARSHQEAIGHLNDALALLNEVATRQSSAGDAPHCMRCDKPVDRIGLSPKPSNPEVVCVEYECHREVVRQELPASAVEGGLARYSAFNVYTSGLMPMSPDERA